MGSQITTQIRSQDVVNSQVHTTACFSFSLPVVTSQSHTSFATSTKRRTYVTPKHARKLNYTHDCQFAYETKSCQEPTSKANKEQEKHEHEYGVTISREGMTSQTRRNRALKLRRWTKLSELDLLKDIEIDTQQDERVNVWVVIQRLGQQTSCDFKVVGKTKTTALRICDRCAKEFNANSEGRFEVVLIADQQDDENSKEKISELEKEAEAIDVLEDGMDTIDLSDHVRDSVLLGFPSKLLCSDSCNGPTGAPESDLTNNVYSAQDVGSTDGWQQELEGNEALQMLKQQMLQQQSDE